MSRIYASADDVAAYLDAEHPLGTDMAPDGGDFNDVLTRAE